MLSHFAQFTGRHPEDDEAIRVGVSLTGNGHRVAMAFNDDIVIGQETCRGDLRRRRKLSIQRL